MHCILACLCTYRDAFYKDLKYQIKRGDIKIPDNKKSTVGAKLAQADFGDLDVASDSTCNSAAFVYPPYYTEAEWNDGIAYLISKEHKKLRGLFSIVATLIGSHPGHFLLCNVYVFLCAV